jgi:hypothetical protein
MRCCRVRRLLELDGQARVWSEKEDSEMQEARRQVDVRLKAKLGLVLEAKAVERSLSRSKRG